MEEIVLLAPAKLTLSLRITGVRADGYHLIDAEMVTLDLADRLVVSEGDGVSVRDHTETMQGAGDDLVQQALRLVGRSARVEVLKRIPAGAGLGGGSADAAAILRWAGFSDLAAAARIGADVPFCLVGGRCRVRGIGEVVEPLEHQDRVFTLLTPPFGCSTPEVYRTWDELGGPGGEGANDLEPAALALEPRLVEWREELAAVSGRRPVLAGSGSTWFVEGSFPGQGRVVVRTCRL